MLTQNQLKEILHYNFKTGIFTWKKSTARRIKVGAEVNGLGGGEYFYVTIKYRRYSLHRLVWLYIYGRWPRYEIDHINHNRVDNRLKNLREVTRQGNSKNRSLYSFNTSGAIGVGWFERDKKWYSRIKVDGKLLHLGYFKNKQDAIAARKQADIKYGFHENHGLGKTKYNNKSLH